MIVCRTFDHIHQATARIPHSNPKEPKTMTSLWPMLDVLLNLMTTDVVGDNVGRLIGDGIGLREIQEMS